MHLQLKTPEESFFFLGSAYKFRTANCLCKIENLSKVREMWEDAWISEYVTW